VKIYQCTETDWNWKIWNWN